MPLNGYPTTKTGADAPCDVTTTLDGATDKCALDTNVTGGNIDVTLSGLNIAGRITKVTINDTTYVALPAIPLDKRNAMSIQNISGVQISLEYDSAAPIV